MLARTTWLPALLATSVTVAAIAVLTPAGRHAPRGEAATSRRPGAVAPAENRGLAVLRAWDRSRAAAWARADPAGLSRLYLATSTAGRRDRALLTAYRSRGLRVVSMHRQVMRVRVRHADDRRVVMVVTDRLVDAVVTGRGGRRALPTGPVGTRLLVFRRVGPTWRLAAAVGRAGVRPPGPTPARR